MIRKVLLNPSHPRRKTNNEWQVLAESKRLENVELIPVKLHSGLVATRLTRSIHNGYACLTIVRHPNPNITQSV